MVNLLTGQKGSGKTQQMIEAANKKVKECDGNVVFIKNIDNVVPDRLKEDTVENKKLLAGILVELQQQAFAYLEKLDSGCYNTNDLMEMLQFLQKKICLKLLQGNPIIVIMRFLCYA